MRLPTRASVARMRGERNDDDKLDPPESLRAIGAREHAGLVGLLAERQQLIDSGHLYVVFGVSPQQIWSMLQIDCGIMLIALTKRLAGDAVAAEDALRDAVWGHMRAHSVALAGKEPADVDLSVAREMLKKWQKNPNDWFVDAVWSAYRVLHGSPDDLTREEGAEMFGKMGGDIWRLYAATLSVLGDPCSRHWPGDDRGY